MELALVVSGASGSALAVEVARRAGASPEVERLHVVVTGPGARVAAHELGREWAGSRAFCRQLAVAHPELEGRLAPWPDGDLMAPIASGSYRLGGVAVVPCSAGMAGAIAHGISRGLGQRVADVALKQRWPLVLGIRETPMSAVLLENLLRLARLGVHVVPPVPAFYLEGEPEDALGRFRAHYAVRVLDLLGVPTEDRGLRWEP